MKILIVDNETIRQRNLRAILSSLGYKPADIDSFDDAAFALTSIKKKRYDCAFISFSMPIFSGLDILKQVRESTHSKEMAIVIYGSQISKQDVIEAAQAGVSGLLGYPFTASDVEEVIRKAQRNLAKS